MTWSEFQTRRIDAGNAEISVRIAGSGPGVLLLHGFPETKEMWRRMAPELATDFTVVCADLRGYGESSCPPSDPEHVAYSKRTMAADMVTAMGSLGFERFSVVGHDRGGRVAYRLALDHPARVDRLAVLDVLPVDVVWDRADDRAMLAFWPWGLLAQDFPLPESVLGGAAVAVIAGALDGGWGTPPDAFDADLRAAYLQQLSDPVHAHAICEEYRAAATIDRVHDTIGRTKGDRIGCPVLALWSGSGPLGTWYDDLGGPLGVWRGLADDVSGSAVDGGHFFPEEHPEDTSHRLRRFLLGGP